MKRLFVLCVLLSTGAVASAMPENMTTRAGLGFYDVKFDEDALGGADIDRAPGLLLHGAVGWRLPAGFTVELEAAHPLEGAKISSTLNGAEAELRQQGLWLGWRSATVQPFFLRLGMVRNQLTMAVVGGEFTVDDTAPGLVLGLELSERWDVELGLQDFNDEFLDQAVSSTLMLGVSRRF